MDIIFLRDLKAECVIGVWDWERRIRQRVSINLEMGTDIKRAADSDRLEDTLNYKAVAKRVIAFVEESEFQLIETLAERIAGLLREEFAIPWCRVTLDKGGAVRAAAAWAWSSNGAVKMPEVYVSIGSNVDREANVREALRLMEEQFGALWVSSVYETESVGFSGPNFYNLVAGFETARPLTEVAEILSGIEDRRGRRRDGSGFDDRTLDLDVLMYGDTVNHQPPCDIPRPDILEYAFVLCPLAEIAGHRVHPEVGRTFAELWAAFTDDSQRLWRVGPASHEAERADAL